MILDLKVFLITQIYKLLLKGDFFPSPIDKAEKVTGSGTSLFSKLFLNYFCSFII